jgi:hypothetical protein
MVELIGKIASTKVQEDRIIDEWRMPAQTDGLARRQATANARIKGRNDVEIKSVEENGNGSLPGQSIYTVTTSSAR